jgi:DNA-binding NarL/FixJ family response regulator
MSTNKINLLVVDDHPMVLEGLKAMLAQITFVNLVATAANAIDAVAAMKLHPEIEVAIVDINLPDISGIELTGKMKKEFPTVQVLAMSTFKERSYITQMILKGAVGYLVKSSGKEEIEEAILCAYEGKLFLSTDLEMSSPGQAVGVQSVPFLTSREKEVLHHIADGLTNPQIASLLFISQHTVESHRKNLLAKFDVKNTANLIKLAAQYRLID